MKVIAEKAQVLIGDRVSISFQRTLRIPEDNQLYPLPPGLGFFTVHKIEDYSEHVPQSWRERGGYFITMYQREALWIGFNGCDWRPNAIKVALGGINAVSGGALEEGLHNNPQDYIVCPNQPWLDGVNAGDGFVRQFIAMPLGADYTVEKQVSGKDELGGIQVLVYEPKPGVFPDEPPPQSETVETLYSQEIPFTGEMGIGVGGMVRQKVYADEYGLETWNQDNCELLFVRILNSEQYREVTGQEPPPPPINVDTYVQSGLPWFDYYDEAKVDLSPSPTLADLKTVGHKDSDGKGVHRTGGEPIRVDRLNVRELSRPDGEREE